MKTFRSGNRVFKASHLWKTHPHARGSLRFTYIYRFCELLSISGDIAVVRFNGLKSTPKKEVRLDDLVSLADNDHRMYPTSI